MPCVVKELSAAEGLELVKTQFKQYDVEKIHNYYICKERGCCELSPIDQAAQKEKTDRYFKLHTHSHIYVAGSLNAGVSSILTFHVLHILRCRHMNFGIRSREAMSILSDHGLSHIHGTLITLCNNK